MSIFLTKATSCKQFANQIAHKISQNITKPRYVSTLLRKSRSVSTLLTKSHSVRILLTKKHFCKQFPHKSACDRTGGVGWGGWLAGWHGCFILICWLGMLGIYSIWDLAKQVPGHFSILYSAQRALTTRVHTAGGCPTIPWGMVWVHRMGGANNQKRFIFWTSKNVHTLTRRPI